MQKFDEVVAAFAGTPDVEPPLKASRFGGYSLKVRGSIFAMLAKTGEFVVKLPKSRVDELVADGKGVRFDPRKNGREMKEWLVVADDDAAQWTLLAKEAHQFVSAK